MNRECVEWAGNRVTTYVRTAYKVGSKTADWYLYRLKEPISVHDTPETVSQDESILVDV